MTPPSTHSHQPGRKSRNSGFTLVELLVVIVIVATLATLIFTLTSRARLASAKVVGVGQMRSIGVAVASWAADNGRSEPFYFTNGTGDFPHEGGTGGSKYIPGNPAKALYNTTDPDAGYLQNPADFFSPLSKAVPPSREDYNPAAASDKRIWGTYAWFYPYVTAANRGNRFPGFTGSLQDKVNVGVEGRYMMSESYAYSEPKFSKQIFNALMSDGSVQQVAESAEAFGTWKAGN